MVEDTSCSELLTSRLRLRRWRESDLDVFAMMNADPKVMEYFPNLQSREESSAAIARIHDHFERHGFGYWAIEVQGGSPFIGYTGLAIPTWESKFTPCVEIGWKLGLSHWGHGYVTEAALRVLDFAFKNLKLSEVVSFTVPSNNRSRAVMERIGMKHDSSGDFDHPKLEVGHPQRRHVLYRIKRKDIQQ